MFLRNSSVLICVCLLTCIFSCNNNPGNTENKEVKIPATEVSNPATASGAKNYGATAEFYFAEDLHDFGHIVAGEKVSYSFKFKNVGNANLIIASASGSCGCTVPEWPKEPIPPGKEAAINVIFNSEGKFGTQHKTVTLTANTIPNTKVLTITGEVEQKKQ
jgi:hypothetical protein